MHVSGYKRDETLTKHLLQLSLRVFLSTPKNLFIYGLSKFSRHCTLFLTEWRRFFDSFFRRSRRRSLMCPVGISLAPHTVQVACGRPRYRVQFSHVSAQAEHLMPLLPSTSCSNERATSRRFPLFHRYPKRLENPTKSSKLILDSDFRTFSLSSELSNEKPAWMYAELCLVLILRTS